LHHFFHFMREMPSTRGADPGAGSEPRGSAGPAARASIPPSRTPLSGGGARRRLRDTLDRIQRQFEAVRQISQLDALTSGDVDALAREIAIRAADAVGCERVNIWLFNQDETELHCIELYEATAGRHSRGMVLREPDFSSEFQALKHSRYVDADDPLTDPRTAGYVERYVRPLGITSMLDAVVRASSRNLGVLCFEHVGRAHHWEPDEIAFACQLADKIGLTLLTRTRQRSAERLRLSEATLAEAQALAHVGSWDLEPQTGAIVWSKEMFRILGLEDVVCVPSYATLLAAIHPEDRAEVEHAYQTSLANGSTFSIDHRICKTDGEVRFVHARGRTFKGADGRLRLIGTVRDITDQKHTEDTLQFANTLLRTEMENSPDGVLVVDPAGRVLSYNTKFADMWQLSGAELRSDVAPILTAVTARVIDPDTARARLQFFHDHPEATGDDELQTVDGRFIDRHTAALRTGDGGNLGRVWFFRDVTDRRRAEELIRQSARQDTLTGLANRAVFVEDVRRNIAVARRHNRRFAVLYLDLDHFKDVNDTLGHPVGDTLLKMVSERLRSRVRQADTVARFGGDEFAVMMTDAREPMAAATLAATLINALRDPFQIRGNDIRTGASIGIAMFEPDDDLDAEALLGHADVALYHVKSAGRDGYRFFTTAMDEEVRTRVALTAELREAIAAGQLFLEYQPQIEIATGRIIGVEALVRWRHAERGVLNPDHFIRTAEESGLIRPLSRWVLRESCRQVKRWVDAGAPPVRVAINLSGALFKMADELHEDLDVVLRETGVPADCLEVELTETILMKASLDHSDLLQRLRARGVSVAIDDFGTGYSSLDYLRRFPVDRIKIAQEFVTHIADTQGSAAIVKTTITLARELGMAAIAEGVERADQLALLEEWGCEHAQGYLFARPLAADAVLPLLRSGYLTSGASAGT
jgi:diguanylate cyclase (GGDEF)-like protein/PAS domain S-box-containing protein